MLVNVMLGKHVVTLKLGLHHTYPHAGKTYGDVMCINSPDNLRNARQFDLICNPRRIIAINLFLFSCCIYILTSNGSFDYAAADVSYMRREVVKSIVERGDLSVPAGTGIRGADGRDYSWFGIGSTLLSVPLYISGKIVGLNEPDTLIYAVNPLISAATLVLIFRFCLSLGYSIRSSFFTSLLYGFGTLAWRFSKDPGDHALETFFILFCFYCAYLYSQKRQAYWIVLSGIFLGIACLVRQTSLLALPSLLPMLFAANWTKCNFYEFAKKTAGDCFIFALAFLPFAIINLWYNNYRFGSYFESGYTLMATRAGISYFTNTSIIEGIKGFLISPGKGFFYYSPITILFFFSIKSFFKKHMAVATGFICLAITYLAFYSKYIYWHGDCAWGPRYIFLITPYLIIPIAALFCNQTVRTSRVWRHVFSFLLILSFLIQLLSISVNSEKYFVYLIDHGVKFNYARGDGIQTINVPAPETYYNWRLSPIFLQSTFLAEILKDMKNYQYVNNPENTTSINMVKLSVHMHVLDYWFVYTYFLRKSISGFIGALFLFFMIIFIGLRLKKLLAQDSQ